MRRALAGAALLAVALLGSAACTSQAEPVQPTVPVAEAEPSATPSQRDHEGAVAAAEEVVRTLNSTAMYDRQKRNEVLAELAHPAYAVDDVAAGFDHVAGLLGLDSAGRSPDGELVARAAALGSSVTGWRGADATVDLWTLGLLGVAGAGSSHPVQETWTTERVHLTWDGAAWRWSGLESLPGPVPVAGQQVPSPPEALASLPGQPS